MSNPANQQTLENAVNAAERAGAIVSLIIEVMTNSKEYAVLLSLISVQREIEECKSLAQSIMDVEHEELVRSRHA